MVEYRGRKSKYAWKHNCKNLDSNALDLLLVWVDKENSMEFPLNFLYYLYNYCMVCALYSHSSHVT